MMPESERKVYTSAVDTLTFVKWHERFEERATLAAWDNEQKLHQLKFHVGRTHCVCLK